MKNYEALQEARDYLSSKSDLEIMFVLLRKCHQYHQIRENNEVGKFIKMMEVKSKGSDVYYHDWNDTIELANKVRQIKHEHGEQ